VTVSIRRSNTLNSSKDTKKEFSPTILALSNVEGVLRGCLATEDTENKLKMDEKIIEGSCWVAYFDILGFKSETRLNTGQLSVLAYMYKEAVEHINGELKSIPNFGSLYDCLWFSDSFLLYSLDDSIKSYNTICIAVTHFFDYMIITKKWLLRGALTAGDFYADRNSDIYLGEALIDAHNFTEKQDWIGLVLTPNAHAKLVANGHNPFIWVDGRGFREYDVPIKRRTRDNGLEQISLDCEKLWAYHYRNNDRRRDIIMDLMRSACNRKGGLAIEHRRKYENTLRFYEAPCQCSVCSKCTSHPKTSKNAIYDIENANNGGFGMGSS
jgi:hypothetical protein